MIKKLKGISPLESKINNILLNQFSGLSITLVGSVFIISAIQGIVFSIGALIVGLPALFFGVAMALAGFIPVLGGLLVWLPLSLYLFGGEVIKPFALTMIIGVLVGTYSSIFIAVPTLLVFKFRPQDEDENQN